LSITQGSPPINVSIFFAKNIPASEIGMEAAIPTRTACTAVSAASA